jgi:hypothetical protein
MVRKFLSLFFREEKKEKTIFDELPKDMFSLIVSYLRGKDLANMTQVNKKCHIILTVLIYLEFLSPH